MRIVIVHYAAPPIIGGVEQVIYYHATRLADAGHEVTVVAGRGAAFDPRVKYHPLELADSRHPDILALKVELDAGRFPAERFEAIVDLLYASLRAIPADVWMPHNVLGLHKNLALTAALRRLAESGARVLAWHYDLAWTAALYQPELHDGYPWNLLRQSWPNTRHIAISELRRREVATLFGVSKDDVAIVPGGVDVLAFLKIGSFVREFIRDTCLLDADLRLLLPVRITRRKNIELALRVTAALRDSAYPKVTLVVTGPPGAHNPSNQTYFDELKALRHDLGLDAQVHFLAERAADGVSTEVLTDLYRIADALILPSYEEGFGIPMLEAGLARLPIFCSEIAPLRELAGDEAAYFSPDGDPRQVADLIHRTLIADRATQLRRRVLERYDWRRIVHQDIEALLGGA
jgi:mannosylglucosylglycerate synthase